MFPRALIPCQYIGLAGERGRSNAPQMVQAGISWEALILWRQIFLEERDIKYVLHFYKRFELAQASPATTSFRGRSTIHSLSSASPFLAQGCSVPHAGTSTHMAVQWTRPGNSARLKRSNFLFPRLVLTWMSSPIWFTAGPQEHLRWREAEGE